MTDLKSALTSALENWEPAPAPAPTPQAKRNVTRDVFQFIKDNPGTTRKGVTEWMTKLYGHKVSSTTSLVGQMVKTKMVTETSGQLTTKLTRYVALAPKRRKLTQRKAAPQPQATVQAELIQRVSIEKRPTEWVNKLPLKVAQELYLHLHGIFGAQK